MEYGGLRSVLERAKSLDIKFNYKTFQCYISEVKYLDKIISMIFPEMGMQLS